MTDDDLRELLKKIQELALRPFLDLPGAENDRQLVWALGRIAGIASAALNSSHSNELRK